MAIDLRDTITRNLPARVANRAVAVLSDGAAERESAYPILIPYLDGSVELTEDAPSIRLNPDEAASGSLVFTGASTNGGVDAFVWEDNLLNGGIVLPTKHNKIAPPSCVSYNQRAGKDAVVLDLSKFHTMRRMIVASQTTDLVATVKPSGAQVGLKTQFGDHVFLVYRIGNEVEIRRETVKSVNLLELFGVEYSTFARTA